MSIYSMEVLCLEEFNRERFSVLEDTVPGWGIRRLQFCASDMMALLFVQKFGPQNLIVVIGEFTEMEDRRHSVLRFAEQAGREGVVRTFERNGIPGDRIILLKGNETPEEIEDAVRTIFARLLSDED